MFRLISVSIDGPAPEVHDLFRGVEGSFDAAVWRIMANVGWKSK